MTFWRRCAAFWLLFPVLAAFVVLFVLVMVHKDSRKVTGPALDKLWPNYARLWRSYGPVNYYIPGGLR